MRAMRTGKPAGRACLPDAETTQGWTLVTSSEHSREWRKGRQAILFSEFGYSLMLRNARCLSKQPFAIRRDIAGPAAETVGLERTKIMTFATFQAAERALVQAGDRALLEEFLLSQADLRYHSEHRAGRATMPATVMAQAEARAEAALKAILPWAEAKARQELDRGGPA